MDNVIIWKFSKKYIARKDNKWLQAKDLAV